MKTGLAADPTGEGPAARRTGRVCAILLAAAMSWLCTAQSGAAAADAAVDALVCDQAGPITASRSGRSGRAYPCYTLERLSGLRVGGAMLFCDQPGAIVATRDGRSGRRHDCYALGEMVEVPLARTILICDLEEGIAASRTGLSGRRYGCYTLAPVGDR